MTAAEDCGAVTEIATHLDLILPESQRDIGLKSALVNGSGSLKGHRATGTGRIARHERGVDKGEPLAEPQETALTEKQVPAQARLGPFPGPIGGQVGSSAKLRIPASRYTVPGIPHVHLPSLRECHCR